MSSECWIEGVVEVLLPFWAIAEAADIGAEAYAVRLFEKRAAGNSSLLRYIYYGLNCQLKICHQSAVDTRFFLGRICQFVG